MSAICAICVYFMAAVAVSLVLCSFKHDNHLISVCFQHHIQPLMMTTQFNFNCALIVL